jgi:hypothetical protein
MKLDKDTHKILFPKYVNNLCTLTKSDCRRIHKYWGSKSSFDFEEITTKLLVKSEFYIRNNNGFSLNSITIKSCLIATALYGAYTSASSNQVTHNENIYGGIGYFFGKAVRCNQLREEYAINTLRHSLKREIATDANIRKLRLEFIKCDVGKLNWQNIINEIYNLQSSHTLTKSRAVSKIWQDFFTMCV